MTWKARRSPDAGASCFVSSFIFPRKFGWVCGWSFLLIAVLTWLGWGFWGSSVMGDYALDMADALRLSQGDIPYRDFLPTYGPLHMFLMAPFFKLGTLTLPSIWTATIILITIQTWLLLRLANASLPIFWTAVLGVLQVCVVAFAPANSKFVLGYSQSGFLASFLWVLLLALLAVPSVSRWRWFGAGLILGLQPYTKMDMGIAAVAVLVALLFLAKRDFPLRRWMLVGFFGSWMGIIVLLLAWGADARLLLESTLEGFGQSTMIGDQGLTHRFILLAGGGLILALALAHPRLRPIALRARKTLAPWIPLLLPLALLGDLGRGWYLGPYKNLVLLNFTWALAWTVVAADLAGSVLRHRGLDALRRSRPDTLLLVAVGGIGLLRVAITGWYPLNYYQPALLLLGIGWMARQEARPSFLPRSLFRCVLILALLIQIVFACYENQHFSRPRTVLETRSGPVVLTYDSTTLNDVRLMFSLLSKASADESILCAYEPGFQLVTGMRSAAFYTYFARVGFSGAYQPIREKQALQTFLRKSPRFVLVEKGRATFSRQFGTDYGRELQPIIQSKYRQIFQSHPASMLQMQIYERNEPRP